MTETVLMPEVELSQVRIVLVEPAGALNVGSVARVMKNMGLSRLVLVNPRCDRLSDEARLMAVHAADVLEAAEETATLTDALQGCQRVIATTGRDDTTLNMVLEPPRTALPWLVERSKQPAPAALIFGREDRGLTNEELNLAQRLVYIPSSPVYASLNLAQAAAICCYELNLAMHPLPQAASAVPAAPTTDLATIDQLEGYYQQLETLLLQIGYLHPHTAVSRMKKLRRLFSRAYLSGTEVAMLRGILSQVRWAIDRNQPNQPRRSSQ